MSIDITPLIEAIIALLALLITGRVIPWLKARLDGERMARLEAACNIAVYAAEEVYRAGHGEEKLEYACRYLRERGFDVDRERILAAVRRMRDGENAGKAGISGGEGLSTERFSGGGGLDYAGPERRVCADAADEEAAGIIA